MKTISLKNMGGGYIVLKNISVKKAKEDYGKAPD